MCWVSNWARWWAVAAFVYCVTAATPLAEANAPRRAHAAAEPGRGLTTAPILAIAHLPSPSYEPTVSWVLHSPADGVRVILYAVELDGPVTPLLQVEASAGTTYHEYVDHRRVEGERLYRLVVVDRLGREHVLANVLCALPTAGSRSTLASAPSHDSAVTATAATLADGWAFAGLSEQPLHSPNPVIPPPSPPPEGWVTAATTI
jgi:hypothetical protein